MRHLDEAVDHQVRRDIGKSVRTFVYYGVIGSVESDVYRNIWFDLRAPIGRPVQGAFFMFMYSRYVTKAK